MPSAKEYFQMKKESINHEDYQKRLREHRKKVAFAVIIIFILLSGIAVGICYLNSNKIYDSFKVLSEAERQDSDAVNYMEFNGNMLKISMDGISCLDQYNNLIWNQSFEMKNPIVDICEKYVAVCDENGNKVYILNVAGLQGELETQLPIRRIQVANQGVVALHMQDIDVNRINYYDKEGTLLAENKAPIEKSGFPMDISLSNDALKLGVSYMLLENGMIQTKLAFYNFDSVGANEIDHLVSGADYEGSIIPKVEFVNTTTAIAFGDDFFEVYQGTKKPVSIFRQSFEHEVQSIFYNEKYVGFIFKNVDTEKPYRMEIYNLKGTKIAAQDIDLEYDNIQMKYDTIYVMNEVECVIYNIKGIEKFRGGFEGELQSIIPLTASKIIAVLENKIVTIKLQ